MKVKQKRVFAILMIMMLCLGLLDDQMFVRVSADDIVHYEEENTDGEQEQEESISEQDKIEIKGVVHKSEEQDGNDDGQTEDNYNFINISETKPYAVFSLDSEQYSQFASGDMEIVIYDPNDKKITFNVGDYIYKNSENASNHSALYVVYYSYGFWGNLSFKTKSYICDGNVTGIETEWETQKCNISLTTKSGATQCDFQSYSYYGSGQQYLGTGKFSNEVFYDGFEGLNISVQIKSDITSACFSNATFVQSSDNYAYLKLDEDQADNNEPNLNIKLTKSDDILTKLPDYLNNPNNNIDSSNNSFEQVPPLVIIPSSAPLHNENTDSNRVMDEEDSKEVSILPAPEPYNPLLPVQNNNESITGIELHNESAGSIEITECKLILGDKTIEINDNCTSDDSTLEINKTIEEGTYTFEEGKNAFCQLQVKYKEGENVLTKEYDLTMKDEDSKSLTSGTKELLIDMTTPIIELEGEWNINAEDKFENSIKIDELALYDVSTNETGKSILKLYVSEDQDKKEVYISNKFNGEESTKEFDAKLIGDVLDSKSNVWKFELDKDYMNYRASFIIYDKAENVSNKVESKVVVPKYIPKIEITTQNDTQNVTNVVDTSAARQYYLLNTNTKRFSASLESENGEKELGDQNDEATTVVFRSDADFTFEVSWNKISETLSGVTVQLVDVDSSSVIDFNHKDDTNIYTCKLSGLEDATVKHYKLVIKLNGSNDSVLYSDDVEIYNGLPQVSTPTLISAQTSEDEGANWNDQNINDIRKHGLSAEENSKIKVTFNAKKDINAWAVLLKKEGEEPQCLQVNTRQNLEEITAEQEESIEIQPKAEGTLYLVFYNSHGNRLEKKLFYIDCSGPSVTVEETRDKIEVLDNQTYNLGAGQDFEITVADKNLTLTENECTINKDNAGTSKLKVKYRIDNGEEKDVYGTWIPKDDSTGTYTFTGLMTSDFDEHQIHFKVEAYDNVNHKTEKEWDVRYDTSPPRIALETKSDETSGIKKLEFTVTDGFLAKEAQDSILSHIDLNVTKSIAKPSLQESKMNWKTIATPYANIEDNLQSDIVPVKMSIVKNYEEPSKFQVIVELEEGYYDNVTLRAEDLAGNDKLYEETEIFSGQIIKEDDILQSLQGCLVNNNDTVFPLDFQIKDESLERLDVMILDDFEKVGDQYTGHVYSNLVGITKHDGKWTFINEPPVGDKDNEELYKIKLPVEKEKNPEQYLIKLSYKQFAQDEIVCYKVCERDDKLPDIEFGAVTKNVKYMDKDSHYFMVSNNQVETKLVISDRNMTDEYIAKSKVKVKQLDVPYDDWKDVTELSEYVQVSKFYNPLGQEGSPINWTKEVSKDGQDKVAYSANLKFLKEGRYLIQVTCQDAAGNDATYPVDGKGGATGNEESGLDNEDDASVPKGDVDGVIIDQTRAQDIEVVYAQPASNPSSQEDSAYTSGPIKYDTTFDRYEDVKKETQYHTNDVSVGSLTVSLKATDSLTKVQSVKMYLYDSATKLDTNKNMIDDITSKILSESIPLTQNEDGLFVGEVKSSSVCNKVHIILEVTDLAGNKAYVTNGIYSLDNYAARFTSATCTNQGTVVMNAEAEFHLTNNFNAGDSWKKCIDVENMQNKDRISVSDLVIGGFPENLQKNNPEGVLTCPIKVSLGTGNIKDGDYQFRLKYVDGTLDNCVSDYVNVVIDKTNPMLSFNYSNNNLINNLFYNSAQTLNISVVEKHPDFGKKVVDVTKNGANFGSFGLDQKGSMNGVADQYSLAVPFEEDGFYQWTAQCTDQAGNSSEKITNQQFIIDRTAPTVTVDGIKLKHKNGSLLSKVVNYLTFGYFCNERIDITVTAYDNLSGVAQLTYYTEDVSKGKSDTVTVAGKQLKEDDYKSGEMKSFSTTFSVSPKFKGSIYVKVKDFADNESNNGKYIKSDAFILKNQADEATLRDSIGIKALSEPNENGFYNKDFKVKMTAVENYDGIRKVSYKAGSSEVVEESFEKAKDVTYGWEKTATIKAIQNNSNRVTVSVSYYDNAGNPVVTKSENYKVDVTKPILTVSYDNNDASNDTYYKASRVATIEINERNFNANDVKIKVTKNGEEQPDLLPEQSDWESAGNVHTAKVAFTEDGDYTFTVSYTDLAGNAAEYKHKDEFTIDKTKPLVDVKYDNNSVLNETYYKENRVATITITEKNFRAKELKLVVTRGGSPVGKYSSESLSWTNNGDNHVARFTLDSDGEYKITTEYTDLADNKCQKSFEDEFTIDKTNPVVAVTYDNNRAQSQQYYSKARTATITVTEKNFDAQDVKVTIARKDKLGNGVPKISGWSGSSDKHTATVTFNSDGVYSIDVELTDMAGNNSDEFKEETFTIDLTQPKLSITGVENASAYSGKIIPVISCTDTNLDRNATSITLTGYRRGKVNVSSKVRTMKDGVSYSLDIFPKKKNIDDVYTLTVKAVDQAGNSISKKVVFSINRFGSNYYVEDTTTNSVLNSYIRDEKDIVIEEINVCNLKNYKVTCTKDGKITELEEGKDYQVKVESGDYKWRKYVYTIYAKGFEKEGNYSICISSEDMASNLSNNEEKDQNLRFTVDKTAPTLTVAGIQSDTIYNAPYMLLDMIASDNIMVKNVKLLLNGELHQEWKQDEIEEAYGQLSSDIPESTERQNLVINLVDIAGNTSSYEISDFLITQNKWVQFYNNKKALVGTVGGAGFTIAAVCYVLLRRRRA